MYGRNSSRFDQIYGSDFQYDPRTGDVTANGEVHIDLESNADGALRPDQTPPQETKNPIHLKTSGLTFNQKTGFAQTKERIEFRIPEATGSAVGATYDSHANLLTLQSAVRVVTTDNHKATITAQRATFTKEPQRAVLESARMEQPSRSVQADKVTVMLRNDNTIDRVLASGNIHIQDTGPKAFKLNAPQAEVLMADKEQVRSGTLFGGVVFESGGDSPAHGTAGRLLLDFGPKSQLTKARAQDSVQMTQGTPEKSMQLQAAAVDVERAPLVATVPPLEVAVRVEVPGLLAVPRRRRSLLLPPPADGVVILQAQADRVEPAVAGRGPAHAYAHAGSSPFRG